MRSLPLTTRVVIVSTVAASTVLTAYAAIYLPAHGNHVWWLVFLCAAMVGEALRVSGDGESGTVAEFTFSMAVLIAAALLFGPVVGATLSFASLAVVDVARREKLYRLVFNAATYALAGAGAGCAFLAAGGHLGQIGDAHPGALAAAVATHAAITTGVIGLAIASARGDGLLRGTLRYASAVAPTSLAEYSLGLVLARLSAASPGFVPLLAPLFIAVYRAHSAAVRLATETKQALRGLADIVDARDPYTFEHSERVARYVERLAEALGLPERDVETITRAGRLHDLGKLTVDVAILTKPGRLTEAEFDELKAHPAMSARLLAPFSFAAQEKRLVEHHHERFDGNGYYGVPAARLPIYSHFIILADSWDAMTSDRPYRQALSDSEAAAEIRANLGTQFHPVLGRCFLAVIEGRELHEDLTSEEVAQLHAELASHRDQRFAGARARAERWWRYATWRMLVVPVFVIVAVVAVAPRAGSPIAAVAGLAALAGWWAVSSERRALRRTRRMLAATPVPATVEDVLARVDDRLGLVWVGPLEARAQQLRRSGRGWSSLAPDEVIARIDGLLARTDSRELAAAERSLSRDGSTLALQRTEGRDPMLIVTSGPPLPSAVARSLVQLLISVEVEDALDDVHVARAA